MMCILRGCRFNLKRSGDPLPFLVLSRTKLRTHCSAELFNAHDQFFQREAGRPAYESLGLTRTMISCLP